LYSVAGSRKIEIAYRLFPAERNLLEQALESSLGRLDKKLVP
jgi:hypothetical protein